MITNLKSKSRKVAQRKHAAAAKSTVVQSTPPEPGSWEYMFRMLVVFQRTHGHCEVPYSARSGSLGAWLMQQRLAELSGALAPELRLRLGDLGVQFDSHDLTETNRERRWNEMFEALQEFKDGAGHCDVPAGRPEYSRLSQWLYAQRRLYRTDKLRRDRARLLETIGFNLESATRRSHRQPSDQRCQEWEKKWEEKFAELKAFSEKHGHCKVSIRDASHARLGIWLHLQRSSARAGRLLAARREKLEQLGVVFGPPNIDGENRWNRATRVGAQFHCFIDPPVV